MTPEQWHQIDKLLEAALDHNPEDWPSFLKQACGGDDRLREELHAILLSLQKHEGFLETPLANEIIQLLIRKHLPPKSMGPYQILELLGSGGMGDVYCAIDTRLDRKVAIKVLQQHLTSDHEALKRFEREAKAIATLNHPNILAIYEFDTTNDISFLVTELLEGQTLRMRMAREPIELDRALEIAIAIAEGLSAAHSKRVIHRDLKPENIFLTNDGGIKILDFGLARLTRIVSEEGRTQEVTRSVETESGVIRGTVPYMSPEQVRGTDVDARTDIFSFGCVLYEMVTGTNTFRRNTNQETIGAILHKEPPPVSNEVPKPLREIISRCLRKEPVQRFTSVQELLGALKMVATVAKPEIKPDALPHRRLWPLAAVLILVAFALGVLWKQWKIPSGGLDKIESIAVLPLQNLSGDSNQQYLVDGMTEELIAELSKISALKVISRTSSMQYKDAKKPLPEIAKKLDVDALVEGSVLREGDQVRITVQLIHGPSDRHLWARSYQRQMQGVLALHSEVAQAIVQEIQAKLTPQEQKRLSDKRSVNPAAHEAYLKALYYYRKSYTVEEFQKASQLLQQAATLDPQDPLVQAALGNAYLDSGLAALLTPSEAYSKANEAALRAVQLDDTLAEAHEILGRVHHYYTWNQTAAGEEYRRAIELQPNDAGIRGAYAWYLGRTGRQELALAEAKKAKELDPLSMWRIIDLGMVYRFSRRYEEALAQFKRVSELQPNLTQAGYQMARVYIETGQYEAAINEIKGLQLLDPADPMFTPLLGLAYGLSGKKAEASKILENLQEKRKREYVRPYMLAELYVGLGERNRALEWLEKACEERDDWIVFLHVDPNMDLLRSKPRFQAILKRVGLPTNAN
ncbi:protein kinase [bacterium]|nr:protein kinase [bacterium]